MSQTVSWRKNFCWNKPKQACLWWKQSCCQIDHIRFSVVAGIRFRPELAIARSPTSGTVSAFPRLKVTTHTYTHERDKVSVINHLSRLTWVRCRLMVLKRMNETLWLNNIKPSSDWIERGTSRPGDNQWVFVPFSQPVMTSGTPRA